MRLSIHQPQYLPWLGLLDRIKKSDIFLLLDRVQHEAHSFENRNRIRLPGAPGSGPGKSWLWLTVPLKHPTQVPIAELQIDYSADWRKKHWKSIEQNYGKAPGFRKYAGPYRDVFCDDWRPELFAPMCLRLLRQLLADFGIGTPVTQQKWLDVPGKGSDLILNLCRHLGATTYISGPLGRDYLNLGAFQWNGIPVEFHDYEHPVYQQMYPGFESHMSALDALFCLGDEAKKLIGG